jgi:hypothetical protein
MAIGSSHSLTAFIDPFALQFMMLFVPGALKIYPLHNQKCTIKFVDYVLSKFPFHIHTIQTVYAVSSGIIVYDTYPSSPPSQRHIKANQKVVTGLGTANRLLKEKKENLKSNTLAGVSPRISVELFLFPVAASCPFLID